MRSALPQEARSVRRVLLGSSRALLVGQRAHLTSTEGLARSLSVWLLRV